MYRTTIFATTKIGNYKSYVFRDAYRSKELAISGINILLNHLEGILSDSRRPEGRIMKDIGFDKMAEEYLDITIYVEDMITSEYSNKDMPKFNISNAYDSLDLYSLEQRKNIWAGFVTSRFQEYTIDGKPIGPEYYCLFNNDVESGIRINPEYMATEDNYTPKYNIGDIVIDKDGDKYKILDTPPMPYSILACSDEYYAHDINNDFDCYVHESDLLRRQSK